MYHLGEYEEAEKEFRKAIKIDPNLAAHLGLGPVYRKIGLMVNGREEILIAKELFKKQEVS